MNQKITINVDADTWAKFKALASKNDSNASQELRKFMKKYIDNK